MGGRRMTARYGCKEEGGGTGEGGKWEISPTFAELLTLLPCRPTPCP